MDVRWAGVLRADFAMLWVSTVCDQGQSWEELETLRDGAGAAPGLAALGRVITIVMMRAMTAALPGANFVPGALLSTCRNQPVTPAPDPRGRCCVSPFYREGNRIPAEPRAFPPVCQLHSLQGLRFQGHCSRSFDKNNDDGKHKTAVCPVWCRGLHCRSVVLMFPFHR